MFNSLLAEHKTPFGAVAAGEEMTLRFTLPQGDPRTPSLLLYRAGQPQPLLHTPLCRQGDAFTLRYTPQEPGLYYYGFRLSDGTLLHRAPDGSADYGEGQLWQLTVYDKAYDIPRKFAGQVMYQIFPDRYYNSGREKTGVPADRRLHRDWQEEPQSTPDADGVFRCNDYFGGDLPGITEKLPELAALGVGVLYLNPIFEAHSNHRYNTADYLRIDPLLGTEQDFITLCQRAHEHGIKIILDGVFNHTGSDSLYFNKEGRYGPGGAYRDPRSPYRSWYCWKDAAANMYESWWGFQSLPKLNSRDESWREFLCGENGIVRHWLRLGADGWRLDVAADLGRSAGMNHQFWRDFRAAVKEANPEAVMIAEHYGSPYDWLKGDQWDTVMNYDAFMEPLSWFLTGMEKHSDEENPALFGDGCAFFEAMRYHMSEMPTASVQCAMNELSNHDHSRFMTRTNRRVGRLASAGAKAAEEGISYGIFRQGVVMQMTWPGAPTIYYGDEAGVCGWTDPDSRRTYPWGGENLELIEFHRYMSGIRKRCPAFRNGSLKALAAGDGYIAYGRFQSAQRAGGACCGVTAVNTGDDWLTLKIPVWQIGKSVV